ncbi:MAG TPA: M56 family metallopeptidase [Pirellulales bacterium]|nr:M56 family metallopeptidase [Pirellulales bacterium]
MNAFAARVLWGIFQVTLFTVAGLVVYLLARRRGPAAGALAAAACLLMAVGVSALALAPWPHWYTLAPGEPEQQAATSIEPAAEPASRDSADAARAPAPASQAKAEDLSRTAWAGAAWQDFWQELRKSPGEAAKKTDTPWSPRWPAVLGVLFVVGLSLAIVRLALGLFAVRRLRANTSPIADASLLALAEELGRRLNGSRPVELRESLELGSPATVGWRRPLVILPSDWRDWTAAERRVVLAHEIAHVGRGDYLTGLLGQFSVALHFYHPLVHWLARRLRLELELAADALGAEASGGREAYLITLAQMALRQDDRAIAWAARPFLPSRGAFLRRIDMLRDPKQFRSAAMSRGGRFAIIGCVAAAGLLFAGLRGPQGESVAQQPKKPAATAAASPTEATTVDWSFVPPNPAAVAIIRPAAALAGAEMQPLVKLLNEQVGVEKLLGLNVAELEEIKLIAPFVPDPDVPRSTHSFGILVFRAKAAHDWKAFGENAAGRSAEATFLGKKYYKTLDAAPADRPAPATAAFRYSYYLPDDRTIVLASEPQLQRVLALGKTSPAEPDWADDWPAGEATVMLDLKTYNALHGAELKQEMSRDPVVSSFSPIWEQTERMFLSLKTSDGLQVEALAKCGSAAAAQQVKKTLEAAMTLASNVVGQAADKLAAAPNGAQEAGAMLVLADLATTLVKQAKLEGEGSTVRLRSAVDVDVADTAATVLAPAIMASRTAAKRSQSINNLKYLMIAMHNYHDVYKHFPAAVVIGPDGKTPHSWRIELLPFVEQRALYDQYKMDEPWDSENNKKVLEQMPAVFRHPSADPGSKDASYFAITGETTMFPGTQGSEIKDIRDGTSNTIALVEAQRSIPWTKPEDIAYDPAKPLPKFGGYEPRIFNAAFADGSMRAISQEIDEKLLRALFTKAGGESVQIPSGN